MLTYEDVKNDSAVRTYIQRADESLTALGYTEHSFAHVTVVAENAAYILSTLGYPERWSWRRSPGSSTTSATW